MLAYDPSNAVLVIEDSVVKVVVGSSNDNVNAQVGTEDKLHTLMCLGSVAVGWGMGRWTVALTLGRTALGVSHRRTAGTGKPTHDKDDDYPTDDRSLHSSVPFVSLETSFRQG